MPTVERETVRPDILEQAVLDILYGSFRRLCNELETMELELRKAAEKADVPLTPVDFDAETAWRVVHLANDVKTDAKELVKNAEQIEYNAHYIFTVAEFNKNAEAVPS